MKRIISLTAGVLMSAGTLCANLGDGFVAASERWGLPVVELDLPDGYQVIY